jgi:hypothetical protein
LAGSIEDVSAEEDDGVCAVVAQGGDIAPLGARVATAVAGGEAGFRTRETVVIDTPARRATSVIDAIQG